MSLDIAPERKMVRDDRQDVADLRAQGMTGQNIVCFAKDWNGDPTSVTHVMKLLAQNNRVLWLNSIATRAPKLGDGGDRKRIIGKLKGFLRGPQRINENLSVYTPIVLPLPHNRIAIALNRFILKTSISLLRRKLGMRDFQLWVWPPTAGEYVDILGQSLTVYYCTDAWPGFTNIDSRRIAALEDHLCRRADIVFATSQPLVEQKLALNPETHLAPHGVAYELFAKALDKETVVPPDLASLPKPVLGFYGLIEDWIDLDLIAHLAQKHPEWSIAMLGKVCVDVSALEKYPNVHFLGRKPHSELPNYCKGFSVGIIPYQVIDRIYYVNPIKLREYMSAGLPIVSTELPEVHNYPEHCAVARNHEEFERYVAEAIKNDSPERRIQRSAAMRKETWEHKVVQLSAQVMRVKAQKDRRRS